MMDMFPDRDQLLQELRDENKRLREISLTYCVVCDQPCKKYFRPMYGTQVRRLIKLFLKTRETSVFAHVSEFLQKDSSDGGFALLKHWGLIEPGRIEKTKARKGKTQGVWGITQLGIRFVKREISVPSIVILYNGILLGFDDRVRIKITDVIEDEFDYFELMSR